MFISMKSGFPWKKAECAFHAVQRLSGVQNVQRSYFMNPIVEAEKITFRYPTDEENPNAKQNIPVFENLTLTIEKGSFIAILGHNGSGKSTFAKHINAGIRKNIRRRHEHGRRRKFIFYQAKSRNGFSKSR